MKMMKSSLKDTQPKKVEPAQHTEPKPIRHEHQEDIITTQRQEIESPKVVGKIDLDNLSGAKKKEEPVEAPTPAEKPKPVLQKPETEVKSVTETPYCC